MRRLGGLSSLYIMPTHFLKFGPKPRALSPRLVKAYDTLSKAFSMSRNRNAPLRPESSSFMYASTICIIMVASAINVPGTNPFWHSEVNSCTTSLMRAVSTRVKIL